MNNDNTALDREFGVFSGIGSAALEEGYAQYLEDCEHQKRSEQIAKRNSEVTDYNKLVDEFNELQDDHVALLKDYNNLVDKKNDQLNLNKKLHSELEKLRGEISKLQNGIYQAQINTASDNEEWQEVVNTARSLKAESDISSAQQFSKMNENITNYALLSKTLYTQRKSLIKAIFTVFKPDQVQINQLKDEFNTGLLLDDPVDYKNSNITYSQAISSLTARKAFLNKLDIWDTLNK